MNDHNVMARKVAIAHHITTLVERMDDEPANDWERFVETGRRLGDLAYTIQYADRDLLDPLAQIAAYLQKWMEDILTAEAR